MNPGGQRNWILTTDSAVIGTGETESSAAILTDADGAKVLGVVRVQPTGENGHCLFLCRKHDGPEHWTEFQWNEWDHDRILMVWKGGQYIVCKEGQREWYETVVGKLEQYETVRIDGSSYPAKGVRASLRELG